MTTAATIEPPDTGAPQAEGPPATGRRPTLPQRLEVLALRSVVAVLRGLGFDRAARHGARLGALGYRPFGIRRAVVEKQLRAVFPDVPDSEIRRLARASYEHLGRTAIEAALLPSLGPGAVLGLFAEVEGWEVMQQAVAGGRGVILVGGHHGNWELAAAYIAARGLPVDVLVRSMANRGFDEYLTRTRESVGLRVVPSNLASYRVPRALRKERGVAFLFDQGALGLASTWVPFFGRFAKTPRGPAVFALRLAAPIVFVGNMRLPDGRFRIVFESVPVASSGDREHDVDQIILDCTRALERWVLRAPEQYFWVHRRWKHQRPGTPPELGNPL